VSNGTLELDPLQSTAAVLPGPYAHDPTNLAAGSWLVHAASATAIANQCIFHIAFLSVLRPRPANECPAT
jgi:hypothetical protein